MPRNSMKLDFPGFDVLKKKLDALGGDATQQAVNSALKASNALVASKVKDAMKEHELTGRTEEAIITNTPVKWKGSIAEINVGFDFNDGGLPSIFLMYGTTVHGQPHITPDRNLYNAVYGAAVKREIKAIQEKAFNQVIERVTKL